jgi:hypothetical protein
LVLGRLGRLDNASTMLGLPGFICIEADEAHRLPAVEVQGS